ncbi:hypothetical protein BP5796_01460 [Coleophoma crateriformis]|uniref:LysM domain-containing protein n=1 Tax=Coleophoma crateriformis TaxID=565419 RepID=A0A3D8T0I3_9HELO|nr:hypothetical protein BP5796_01460 [Coleophoma crateriformis]
MNQRDIITSNPRLYSDGGNHSRSGSPAAGSTTTLRPRNKRLLSTAPEQELVSTSGTSTPSGSRGVSPMPKQHLSRTASAPNDTGRSSNTGLVAPAWGRGGNGRASPVGGFGDLLQSGWSSSWSTLQTYANSVLGGDLETANAASGAGNRTRRHRRKASSNVSQSPTTWGPEGLPKKKNPGIGEGSKAERDAELKRRKKQSILEGHEGMVNGGLDINGRYKRRTSLEDTRTNEVEEDALVYIHLVKPQDTLAGVVLKYNCPSAIFKKANGLWSNDAIHIRKHVFLPVDACAIKGKPCEPPSDSQGVDLLAPTPGMEEAPDMNGGTWPTFNSKKETSAEHLNNEDEAPWIHVRWVLLDSSPSANPVEIARMPRKTLGYFPPRRRKSQTTISTISTPRGSSDVPRSSAEQSGSPSSTPQRRTSVLGPRPSSGSYFPPAGIPIRTGRPRRESTSEAAERLGWMRGPGGVGTLTGKNVRMPGPAQDGLNAFAKKHMPGLAMDGLPSSSVLGSETAQFGFSGEELSNIAEAPFGSASRSGTATPSGLGLENAAAAVEGFFRRIATKVPTTPMLGGAVGSLDSGGDLIELLDGAGSDDGRGFELSPGSSRAASVLGGTGREDLESLIRGRNVSGSAKAKKSD